MHIRQGIDDVLPSYREEDGDMETGVLRYFTTTARYEHMGLAATQLGVDESTVSRSVSRLEKRYGPLFDRVGRRVRLNDTGRVLLVHAERILEELERAERAIDNLHGSESLPIRLGLLPSLGMHFVPELVTAFRRGNPAAHFRFMQASREKLRLALMAGEIDAFIACCKFADEAIAWEPLWNEEWQVFVPRTHALARRRIIDLQEIAGEPILSFRTGERMRDDFDALTREAGVTPNVVWEATDVPTLLGLVNLGAGIAVLPESVRENRGRAAAIRLRGGQKRTVGISWLRGHALTRTGAAFRSFVVEHGSHRPGSAGRARGDRFAS
jgi:DNA-binding transcriptional LysR family regulator